MVANSVAAAAERAVQRCFRGGADEGFLFCRRDKPVVCLRRLNALMPEREKTEVFQLQLAVSQMLRAEAVKNCLVFCAQVGVFETVFGGIAVMFPRVW